MPNEQPALEFPVGGTVTAPDWETRPLDWFIYMLETNPALYKAFRRIADEGLRRNPAMTLSADRILHVIRWETDLKGEGDIFKINDHLTALFARLYVLERPQHKDKFRSRKSFLDSLTKNEEERLLLAFEPLRETRRRFV